MPLPTPAEQQPSNDVEWKLFGEVCATLPGNQEISLGQRQRAVLALLLLRANKTVSADEIAEGLWAENPPKTARNSVQRFVADIRRSLGEFADRIETTSTGYRLSVRPGELDLDRARELLEHGRSHLREGRSDHALILLEKGLDEVRGTPLAAIRSDALHREALGPLTELANNIRASRFEAALALGRHTEIGDDLQRFAYENPASERAWSLYMLGLYRSGRQREALAAGEQLRRQLSDEHGITPSPLIAKLTHQILHHADELQLGTTTAPDLDQAPAAVETSEVGKLPPRLSRVLRTNLVGRHVQIERGRQVVEALDRGEPAVTFVAGEPGVGKTRLAAELAALAAAAGSDVFYGRSDEDTALPLGSWTEVLGQLATTDLEIIERVVPWPARASLAAILPQLGGDPADRHADDTGDTTGELRRAALFHAIGLVLAEAALQRPLTLVLDDLQWADASTLQLVRHLARHLGHPVWIIGTYRDNELTDEHLLRDVVATLLREPHVHTEQLRGIDDAGVAKLVQTMVPGVNEARLPDFASALQRETKGNPFFVTEIVRDLIESAPDDQTLRLAEPGSSQRELPDTVRQVIRQRVARLGEQTATTLRCASLFGREFDISELAQILDSPVDHVMKSLEAGLDADIVNELGQRDRFTFVHDLMHHSLYRDLSMTRRRRLHARAAQTISRTARSSHDRTHDDRSSEIAGHFLAACDGGLAHETIQALNHAADVAARRHAPAQAAALISQGLETLDDPGFAAGLGDSGTTASLRLHMLVKQGTELRNAGDPEYRQALLDAGQLAHDMGDLEAEVEAALANTRGLQTNVWTVDTERVAQLKRALAGLGEEESARRANLLASLASEQWHDADREESAKLRAESISLARRVRDPETLANALARAARARNARHTPAQDRELANEMHAMLPAADAFDPYLTVNLLRTLMNQALRDADAVRLYEMCDAIAVLTNRTQLPICHRSHSLSQVLIAGIEGDAEQHLQLAEQALSISLEIGDPESFLSYEGHYFVGMAMLGRTNEILPMAHQMAKERSGQDTYRAIAANTSWLVGDLEPVQSFVDAQNGIGFTPGIDDYTIQALQLWADAAAAVDHRDACERLYELLAPHAGRLSGHAVLVTQPVDLSLGRMCRTLGRFDDAFEHFAVSDRICQAFAATWMQSLTDISRAETLLARGHPGDANLAAHLTKGALARARQHNHGSIIQLADRLASLGHS